MSKQIILAVDFDGTIATSCPHPQLGFPQKDVAKYIRKLYESDCYYIIIWTCREGKCVENIKQYCTDHNIPYHQINQHHPELVKHYGNDTRKVCADIYVDDKNLGGLPSTWRKIYNKIKNTHFTNLALSALD